MKLRGPATLALLLAASHAAANISVTTYETLSEGFLGQSFTLNGVHYRDCNNVGGVFPDGSTFVPADIGDNFIIENSTFFFNDFPAWGSPVNTLTFSTAFVPGNNLSLGAFARATLDFPQRFNTLSMDIAYYENGPWGGIVLHMDAYDGGQQVVSQSITIANGGGRDNIATGSFVINNEFFDSVRLYATFNGEYSAPRLLVDDLSFGVSCGSADFDNDGDTGTDQDIEAFFACLAGNCCTACGTADFDGDGDTGTDFDIEAFFRVLAGGTC